MFILWILAFTESNLVQAKNNKMDDCHFERQFDFFIEKLIYNMKNCQRIGSKTSKTK